MGSRWRWLQCSGVFFQNFQLLHLFFFRIVSIASGLFQRFRRCFRAEKNILRRVVNCFAVASERNRVYFGVSSIASLAVFNCFKVFSKTSERPRIYFGMSSRPLGPKTRVQDSSAILSKTSSLTSRPCMWLQMVFRRLGALEVARPGVTYWFSFVVFWFGRRRGARAGAPSRGIIGKCSMGSAGF